MLPLLRLSLFVALYKPFVHADLGTGFLDFLALVLDAASLFAELLLVLVDLCLPVVHFGGFGTLEHQRVILVPLVVAHTKDFCHLQDV